MTAHSDAPPTPYSIFLDNGHGVYVDSSATCSFQGGYVLDDASSAVIGYVPGPGLQIYNSNGVQIWYLSQ